MTLTLLSPEAYETHLAAHYGVQPGRTPEAIAEVLRAELCAFGFTSRWQLRARVQTLLARFDVTAEDVAETQRTLESVGDIVAGSGGEVARAPLRAVLLRPGSWMIVGTNPTRELSAALGARVSGLPRRMMTEDDARVRATVLERGGRVIDVARWSGLDRAPSREQFIEELGARLDATLRFADRATLITWSGLEMLSPSTGQTNPERAWKSAALVEVPALVRARQASGWYAYGWARQVGPRRDIVPISGDEARRAAFVVCEKAGAPVRLAVSREGEGVEMALPVLLPAAEYRWLAAMGEMLNAPRRVRLDELVWKDARSTLEERLGILVEGAS